MAQELSYHMPYVVLAGREPHWDQGPVNHTSGTHSLTHKMEVTIGPNGTVRSHVFRRPQVLPKFISVGCDSSQQITTIEV